MVVTVPVLNPELYASLQRAFGRVQVSSAGQSSADGRGGEHYRVDCPYCGDRRGRLYVSYLWGTTGPDGRPRYHLLCCFNEDCLADADRRRDFRQRVLAGVRLPAIVPPPAAVRTTLNPPSWPGPVVRLDRLPSAHPAVVYVRQRGFDPQVLGRYYGVSYCVSSSRYPQAAGRIVVPVYFDQAFRGWQARYVGELPWSDPDRRPHLPPKYYTAPGFPKSRVIGNFDNAVGYETLVVVEGWFDVFAVGPWAVCLFGHTASGYQIERLAASSRRYGQTIAVVLDPDAADAPWIDRLSSLCPGRVVRVTLPGDQDDPGAMSRMAVVAAIRSAAAAAGVPVAFRRRVQTREPADANPRLLSS